MKKTYELTMILPATVSEKDAKALVAGLLAKSGGKVTGTDFWGKRDLAYPIKKQTKALYVLFNLELTSEEALELDKRIRLEEGIMRYLLISVKADKVKSKSKKKSKALGTLKSK
jgi:small subunit ribosomal protein S6